MLHFAALEWLPGLERVAEDAPLPLRVLLAPKTVEIPPVVPAAVPPAPTSQPGPDAKKKAPEPKAVPAKPGPVLAMPAQQVNPVAVTTAIPPSKAEQPAPPPVTEPARVAPPPASPDLQALAGYGRSLAAALAIHQRYPRIARMRQWQGTTMLQLELAADGRLLQSRVLSSSGHEILDRQAQEMLRAALPLPTLPPGLAGRPLVVNVPVVFRLAG